MAKPLVDDELWKLIQPLLPVPMPRRWRYPGRKRLQNRRALTGILFVLKSGILWEMLPQEMGCGSGMTCWRRLRDWQEVGVGKTVMKCFWPNCEKPTRLTGLEPWWIAPPYGRLAEGGKLGPISLTGASRSKHHLITDAQGIPLAAILMGANRHDVTQLLPLVEAIPSIRGQVGRPRRRPAKFRETELMTRNPTGRRCDRWGSSRSWPNALPSTGVAWASIGGWWSEPWHDCTSSDGCGFAMKGEPTLRLFPHLFDKVQINLLCALSLTFPRQLLVISGIDRDNLVPVDRLLVGVGSPH